MKCVLKNFSNFTGKNQRRSLIFIKAAGLRLTFRHSCFPVNFAATFSRTSFLHRAPPGDCFCTFHCRCFLMNFTKKILSFFGTPRDGCFFRKKGNCYYNLLAEYLCKVSSCQMYLFAIDVIIPAGIVSVSRKA